LTLPNPSLHPAKVICFGIRAPPPIALSTIEDHLDAAHVGKPWLEVLEQLKFLLVNNNE
jgi:hypothetical protein